MAGSRPFHNLTRLLLTLIPSSTQLTGSHWVHKCVYEPAVKQTNNKERKDFSFSES